MQSDVQESLVVPQVQIDLATIVQDVYLTYNVAKLH